MATMPSQRATTPIKTGKMGHHTHTADTHSYSINTILWMCLSMLLQRSHIPHNFFSELLTPARTGPLLWDGVLLPSHVR